MQVQIVVVFELLLTIFPPFAMPKPLNRLETDTDENRTSSENGQDDANNTTLQSIITAVPIPAIENTGSVEDWPVFTAQASSTTTTAIPSDVVVLHGGMGFVLGDASVHLGEICNYEESCAFYEANAECAQVSPYYSKCACKESYILVGEKEAISQKCVPEGSLLTREAPAVFGVSLALIAFAGLTCLALRLFSKARFSEPRGHFANANLTPPPMMMTGVSTISSSAPHSRRSSGRSSISRHSVASTPGSRHPSYSQLALPSRPNSRRPSAASVRSQVSVRSYRHDRGPHAATSGHHEALRATVSAPLTEAGTSPSRISIRLLEQKFGQHMVNVHSYPVRREKRASRESSRHSSQEIITEVIAEDIEKCELAS